MTLRWLYGAIAAWSLAGCVATAPPPEADAGLTIIAGVPPFAAQVRDDDCAGVALSSLLSHAGIAVPPAVVDAAVYDPRIGGALLPDVEKFAMEAGARPRSGRGSIEALRALLRTGHPVLIPLDLGWSVWRRPHYAVIYGMGSDRFVMHVRRDEIRVMTSAELERRWAGMGRLYLYLEQ